MNIIFSPKAFATDTVGEIFDAGDDFLSEGDNPSTVINETKLKDTSSTIYKILLTIAICVAIIIGAVLGLQFILGSVEGKVKVQEALVPYIVGCVVAFGAFTIWGIAVNTGDDIIGPTTTQEIGTAIADGELDPNNLTDDQLRAQFSHSSISSDIYTAMHPRAAGAQPARTVAEAVSKLSPYKQKIYNACNEKGLLNEEGDGLKNN